MKKVSTFGVLFGVSMIAGCPGATVDPAAVLEGTWQVVFAEPGDLEGYDIQATFDDNGQLTEITAESPAGGTATRTVDGATTTEVEGSTVTVTIPVGGGTRIIEGTLSGDQNTITGSLSSELELPNGDIAVTLPGNDLTLERIE